MGARAYLIRRLGDKWEAIYSHWGADYINRTINEIIRKYFEESRKLLIENKDYEPFNPFEELEKAIIRLWDYEEKERNEIAIEIDFPSKFIEWNDIIIEAWVIYTPKKSIHIYENSIINSKVGILLTLEKPLIGSLRSIDIIRVLQCFKHARDVVEFIAYGLKYKCFDVDSVKEAFHHYITSEGYNIKMASNVHLIIDKPNGNLLDIIDGKTKLLIY